MPKRTAVKPRRSAGDILAAKETYVGFATRNQSLRQESCICAGSRGGNWVKYVVKLLLERFASKKFLTVIAAFVILILDGTDAAEFDGEIIRSASATLFAYPILQAAVDGIDKVKKQ